jgi:hypothetical protein
MNVPFYYPIHEAPYDYFRYTKFALQKFADEAQLKVVELSSLGGGRVVAADVISKIIVTIPIIGNLLAKILQRVAGYRKIYNSSFPFVYFAVLLKEKK